MLNDENKISLKLISLGFSTDEMENICEFWL